MTIPPLLQGRERLLLLLSTVLAGVISAALAAWLGGFTAGFAGSDEPSHFVNSVFVSRYLQGGLEANPLTAALQFYLHYPKLLIGQWPPLYYGMVGLVFLVVPPSYGSAMAVAAVVTALPTPFVAWAVVRTTGAAAALLAAVWYATLPVVVRADIWFMTDQSVAFWIVAVAAAWLWYLRGGGLPAMLACAAAVAAAVLTKGNGWQAGLVPVVHMLLLSRFSPLLDWRVYLAGALALAVLVPWYVVTLGVTAESWMGTPGPAYALHAFGVNGRFLVETLGAGLVLAAVGLAVAWTGRRVRPGVWEVAALCLALVVANLVFQAAIPADDADRLLTPSLPGVAVLAAIGAERLLRRLWRAARLAGGAAAAVLLVLALLPTGRMLATQAPKLDLRLENVAAGLLAGGGGPALFVVDGTPNDEGALIAEVAARDTAGRAYVARSSQLLADSNFTGQSYALRVDTPAAVLRTLDEVGASRVALVRRDGGAGLFAHSPLLEAALRAEGSGWRMIGEQAGEAGRGQTTVFAREGEPAPKLAALAQYVSPKARGLIEKLSRDPASARP